jgi:hypothetical protein
MKTFDLQGVEINAPFDDAFAYLADPQNLPRWTAAFKRVSDGRAVMQTETGSVEVALAVNSSREHGTVDWRITFPDGTVASAYSRLVDKGGSCVYSFVLMAPPVPLEHLEGALEQQSQTLREELISLCSQLEGRDSTDVLAD